MKAAAAAAADKNCAFICTKLKKWRKQNRSSVYCFSFCVGKTNTHIHTDCLQCIEFMLCVCTLYRWIKWKWWRARWHTYFFNRRRICASLAVGNIVLILATQASVSWVVNDVSWKLLLPEVFSNCWMIREILGLPIRVTGDISLIRFHNVCRNVDI